MRSFLLASVIAWSVTACVSGYHQAASSNWTPMVQAFPYRAARPIARELRYTYTGMTVLGGKPYGKPQFGADATTTKYAKSIVTPAAVIAAATGRSADEFTRPGAGSRTDNAAGALADSSSARAERLLQQGRTADARDELALSVAARDADISVTQALQSLGRAQASVATIAAVYNALDVLARAWIEGSTRTLGEWVRDSTGVIGAGAPAGTVLQVDFIYVVNGAKWHAESRLDFIAHATLTDATGRKTEGFSGYQLYTVGDKPRIVVPSDAVPLVRGPNRYPSRVQPIAAQLAKDDVWDPYLAIAMSTALADLERKLATSP